MFKTLKVMVLFLISMAVQGCSLEGFGSHAASSDAYQVSDLLENFKDYSTTNTDSHAGNLYEHSLWVAITINEWFACNDEWVSGLTQHDRTIAVIAGLLHDVGKAGDLVHSFYTKPWHTRKGQQYLLAQEPYLLSEDRIFDFDKLFASLHLSSKDRKEIAIIVAAHHELGNLLQRCSTGADASKTDCMGFKDTIRQYASYARYAYPIDKRLLNLVILVSAADVRGSQRCECRHHFSVGDLTINASPCVVHEEATDKFEEFSYDLRGKQLRKLLFQYA